MRRSNPLRRFRATAAPVLGVVVAMTLSLPAGATFIFEGDGDPVTAGWEFNENITPVGGDNGGWWFFDSPAGNIRLITTQSGQNAGGSWYQPPQAVEDAELVRANGWRFDFSAQPQQYIGSAGSSINIADDMGLLDIQLQTSQFVFTGNGTPVTATVNTSQQWPVELVLAPGGTAVDITVNGVSQGSASIASSPRTATLIIGDLASGGRGETMFDYWRLNIPEPSSVALLVMGGLMIAWTRRIRG